MYFSLVMFTVMVFLVTISHDHYSPIIGNLVFHVLGVGYFDERNTVYLINLCTLLHIFKYFELSYVHGHSNYFNLQKITLHF